MPRRYGPDGSRLWNGKAPEDFNQADVYRFMAETESVLQKQELLGGRDDAKKIAQQLAEGRAQAARENAARPAPAKGTGTEEEAQENEKSSTIMEEIAMEDETAMESFLETGRIAGEQIREMIVQRKIFPCFFGSALRNAGVDTFLQGFDRYTLAPEYPDEFGMKVFKIARDEANNRLTYLKVTGGTLKVKSPLSNADHVRFGEEVWEQKVNQIRIYSGTKYELINEADAGMVCAVTGLDHTYPGQGFGIEAQGETPVLEPVLHFRLILPTTERTAFLVRTLRLLLIWIRQSATVHRRATDGTL